MLPDVTLVTGAAASGKTAFAEKLLCSGTYVRHYVATARPFDDEMAAKINLHRAARGDGWHTIEAPEDPGGAIARLTDGAALLDCLTLWLTNRMMAGADLAAATDRLVSGLRAAPVPVVVVTNEIGWGVVPMDRGTRRFRDAHGRMNQAVAALADRVVLVASGLPVELKGPGA